MFLRLTTLLCVSLSTLAYPDGPPTQLGQEYMDTICGSMFPSGHGYPAQTSAAPFRIVTSAQCYKPGMMMNVRIEVLDTSTYFEGYFVQAKKSSDDPPMSYGMFHDANGRTRTHDCFYKEDSAISQNSKCHYWYQVFTWTAPEGLTDGIHFQSTIIHETEEFWVNVKSATLTYDENCEDGTLPGLSYTECDRGLCDVQCPLSVTPPTSAGISWQKASQVTLMALPMCKLFN